MAQTQNTSPRLTTPIGEAVYPALKNTDKKFHDLGIYRANRRVDQKEAKALMKELADMYKAHVGENIDLVKNHLWKQEIDEDGNPTGNVVFKIEAKNILRKDGKIWDRRPKLFDTSNPPQMVDLDPFGGTKMKVSFDVYAYTSPMKGLKLQPVAVQIIELVERGEAGSDDFGFTSEESGYKVGDETNDPFGFTETEEADSEEF